MPLSQYSRYRPIPSLPLAAMVPPLPVLLLPVLAGLFTPAPVSSSRILAVIPTVSKSHFDFFQPLLLALASRGHHLTVVNNHPRSTPVHNYTDISLKDLKKIFFNDLAFNLLPHVPCTYLDNHMFLWSQVPEMEQILSQPDLQRLVHSQEKFDLVLVEMWNNDIALAFAHKFRAPVIALSSSKILPWGNARFGNPDHPAYIPSIFLSKQGSLNFWQRVYNTFQVVSSKLFYQWLYDPVAERIVRNTFGEDIPSLEQLRRNTSLLLVNTHHSLHGPRPTSPQVIEVGGIHLKEPNPLSKDLDRWMNESISGVVYFSFGSMLRGATLPKDKVQAFLEVFAKLPQRVLWKWEEDTVEGLPSNVKIMKWLPQRDVLAHPKVKVFISHGGLLGTTEAIVSGVPILGIPMYGDQPNNVAALVENGVAIHVDYNNISVSSLFYALNTLLTDKSYSENVRQLSRRFLDRPMSPLDTAIYWTEYVIRHRGAPHLQSAAVHLTWYQYYLLDVIAVCVAVMLAALAVIYFLIRLCLRLLCTSKASKLKTN